MLSLLNNTSVEARNKSKSVSFLLQLQLSSNPKLDAPFSVQTTPIFLPTVLHALRLLMPFPLLRTLVIF